MFVIVKIKLIKIVIKSKMSNIIKVDKEEIIKKIKSKNKKVLQNIITIFCINIKKRREIRKLFLKKSYI